jgi:hypothetical protein
MKKINHEVFGEIEYDYAWNGFKNILFMGKEKIVKLIIDGDEDESFEETQIEAYKKLVQYEKELIKKAEEAIFDYYQKVCDEYRDMLEESADEFAPIIENKDELKEFMTLEAIIIPESFKKKKRRWGLLLECTWEPEHGLAVKFEEEEVVEVGYQDIIL